MNTSEIRKQFLEFFESKQHRIVPSSALVPHDDPTLLFVNAGMNQFKNVFLGLEKRDYRRATSVQKCVRAGGKHNDLENVGVTARHHTFFEMLGNFSFGDYFKEEAIDFAWEFLTDQLELDSKRLAVTVFEGDADIPKDDQAKRLWRQYFPEERIHELGKKDNFWSMGDTGPCGPCSEVHFFQGDHLPCEEPTCLGVACECDRWLEIWNLVFMQFNRDDAGELQPLPAPSVDTGMGLERIAAVVQSVESNYDTDALQMLVEAISALAGRKYLGGAGADDVSIRVITDHVRATTFLISDGVMPGNEGRSYVLRKIMRRAMRHGKRLGQVDPFLHRLSGRVIDLMQDAYPDLLLSRELVERVILSEEQRFGTTLATGIQALDSVIAQSAIQSSKKIPGPDAFKLYDTFGLPLDLLEDIAKEKGLQIDRAGFDRAMEEQRRKARESWKKSTPTSQTADQQTYVKLRDRLETEFRGYDELARDGARLVALTKEGHEVEHLREGESGEVFLDITPFYPEGGGQVGDRGILAGPDGIADVVDTQSKVSGLIAHCVKVVKGELGKDQRVGARVDATSRGGAAAHHTTTHLLHAALRETLGPHVKQAGSLVAPGRLRFDFSHFTALSLGELQQIEGRVNEKIQEDLGVRTEELPIDQALSRGAIAMFGEKYGERVRVVDVPGFSLEFCGGTHLNRTGEAGIFVIKSESSAAAGVRRIEALTARAAVDYLRTQRELLQRATEVLKSKPSDLVETAEKLRDELKQREKEVQQLKLRLATASDGASTTQDATEQIGDILVWTPTPLRDYDKKQHRQFVDAFKDKHRDRRWVAISGAVNEQRVSLIVEVSKSLTDRIQADQLMKELTPVIEGRGGGKAERAEAGGQYPDRLPRLYETGRMAVRQALEQST